MFFFKNFFPALFLLLLAVGCSEVPLESSSLVTAPPRAEQEVIEARADTLAKLLAECSVRGVLIEPAHLTAGYVRNPADLVENAAQLGFNRLLLKLPSTELLETDWFPRLAAAARARGMVLELVLRQQDYVYRYRGNSMIRPFISGGPTLEDAAREILDYNRSHRPEERIAAISISVEPELFTSANQNRPKDLLFAWSGQTFGPGLDNDRIMEYTLDRVAVAARLLRGKVELSIGIGDFYQELVEQGKLTRGGISDFLAVAPRLVIRNSGNKPSEAVEAVTKELAVVKSPGAVLISVGIAEHTAVESGALRRRDWNDFLRALTYAVGQWRLSPSFGGVVIGPLHLVETLQKEE